MQNKTLQIVKKPQPLPSKHDLLILEVAQAFNLPKKWLNSIANSSRLYTELAFLKCWDLEFLTQMRRLHRFKLDTPLSPQFVLNQWDEQFRQALEGGRYWEQRIAQLAVPSTIKQISP